MEIHTSARHCLPCICPAFIKGIIFEIFTVHHTSPDMKKMFFTAFTFVWAGLAAIAQNPEFKAGTVLTYNVDYFGVTYQMIVTLQKTEGEVAFRYQMTEPASLEGTVTMAREAVASADILHNYFSGGALKLTDETTVIVSAAVFKKITDLYKNYQGKSYDKSAVFDLKTDKMGGNEKFGHPAAVKEKAMVKGAAVILDAFSVRKIYDEAGNTIKPEDAHEIRVLNNAAFPLITYMNLGWTITLVDIK